MKLRLLLLVGAVFGFVALGRTPASVSTAAQATPQLLTDNLLYATFLGGGGTETIADMAQDAAGNLYLLGRSYTPDFPAVTSGALNDVQDGDHVFVIKLSPDAQQVLYAAAFGGSGGEAPHAIAVDAAGNVLVTGATYSEDFPVTPGAYDATCDDFACSDVFVVKLSADGSRLLFATYIGGVGYDTGTAIAVGLGGEVFVAGHNGYGDFPTTSNAYDRTYNGGQSLHNMGDGFIARLDATGSRLEYSSYLGGRNRDAIEDMVVTSGGDIYVTGSTKSANFPTTGGAYDTSCGTDGDCDETPANLGYGGPSDVFVARFAFGGSHLAYSTFVGASGYEEGYGIHVGDTGQATVTGYTRSTNFPTTRGAYDRTHNGDKDAFLFRLSSGGSNLVYSTLLGGGENDSGRQLLAHSDGTLVVAGETASTNFPTEGSSYDDVFNGDNDLFLAELAPDLSVRSSTFVGGAASETPEALALGPADNLLVAGSTTSRDFPVTADADDDQCGDGSTCSDGFLLTMGALNTITGQVLDWGGRPLANVTIAYDAQGQVTTDAGGNYTITGLRSGDYELTPSLAGYNFLPPSKIVSVAPDASGVDFIGFTDAECALTTDRDGDVLLDGWELCGYDQDGDNSIDVDLPAMGASPLHRDIFVEVDYMVAEAGETAGHRPNAGAIGIVVRAFDQAPTPNPDRSTGIHLHVDFGPDAPLTWGAAETWGALSSADAIAHHEFVSTCPGESFQWGPIDQVKAQLAEPGRQYLEPARTSIFHYNLWVHSLCSDLPITSGVARPTGLDIRNGGSDFIVSLGGWHDNPGTVLQQAGTFMHELGHNLGLAHGGGDNSNHKPNYLSVMNYAFQFRGLIATDPARYFDYSRHELPTLNELNLDETDGIGLPGDVAGIYGTRWYCGNQFQLTFDATRVDWNCDGDTNDTSVTADINNSLPQVDHDGYDDWLHLVFDGGAVGGLGAGETLATETLVDELTETEAELIPPVERAFLPYAGR